jgi:3-hydroxybutyryl-CoA dehydrogenase
VTTNDVTTETVAAAMTAPEIATVAVVGAGTMGWQIAALAAGAGYPVALFDAAPGAADRALSRMRDELPAVLAAGLFPSASAPDTLEGLLGRVRRAASLGDAVAGADLVVEAVREDLATKRAVFADLGRLAPRAILATNSSSLPSAAVADVVPDPSRLLNLHFFAPVWVRPMLEVMGSGATTDAVIAAAAGWGRSLGLAVAVCRGQSKGFIINRVWRAIKRESLRVVDEGHADPEDVDRLFMLFFGSDFGPFGMMDTVGLDVVADIEASYVAVSEDPSDRVSPTLRRRVSEGQLGEKSGLGFYRHPDPAYRAPGFLRGGEGGAPRREPDPLPGGASDG